jgi:hypothetical protein
VEPSDDTDVLLSVNEKAVTDSLCEIRSLCCPPPPPCRKTGRMLRGGFGFMGGRFHIAVGKSDRFVLSTTLLEDRSLGLAEHEAHN